MSTATAKYILTAEDQTQRAIHSAIKNFSDMDRSLKSVVSGINLGLGIMAGTSLKNLMRSSLEASAAVDTGLGAALDKLKGSARELLVMKEGLPGVTQAINDLNGVLSDPSTKSAADTLISTLVEGAATVITGWSRVARVIKEALHGPDQASLKYDDAMRDIDAQIAAKQKSLGTGIGSSGGPLDGGLRGATAKRLQDEIAGLQTTRSGLLTLFNKAVATENAPKQDSSGLHSVGITAKGVATDPEWLVEYRKAIKSYDSLTQTGTEKVMADWKQFDDALAFMLKNGAISPEEASKRATEYRDSVLQPIQITADYVLPKIKDQITELSEWSKEAARGTFNAFAEFFFDPFQNGIKGLASGLIDAFRHALANKAAQDVMNLFTSFGSGGERAGKGGWLGTAIGAVFGGFKAEGGPLQQGKWYVAGEHGPEPVWGGGQGAFAAGYGGGGGAPQVKISITMDNRGATSEAISQLPAYAKELASQVESRVVEGLRRHRYSF